MWAEQCIPAPPALWKTVSNGHSLGTWVVFMVKHSRTTGKPAVEPRSSHPQTFLHMDTVNQNNNVTKCINEQTILSPVLQSRTQPASRGAADGVCCLATQPCHQLTPFYQSRLTQTQLIISLWPVNAEHLQLLYKSTLKFLMQHILEYN